MIEEIMNKSLCRMASYCHRVGEDHWAQKLEEILEMEVPAEREAAEQLLEQWENRILEELQELEEGGSFSRLYYLIYECKMSRLAETILEFALTQVFYPEIKSVVKELFHPEERLTMEDILRIIEAPFTLEADYEFLEETYHTIARLLTIQEDSGKFFFRKTLEADHRLLAYLMGKDEPDPLMKKICELYFSAEEERILYVQSAQAEALSAQLEQLVQERRTGGYSILHLRGERHSGRRYLLKKACDDQFQNMLFVDFGLLLEACGEPCGKTQELEKQLWKIKREMVFYRMGVCLYHVCEGVTEEDTAEHYKKLLFCLDALEQEAYPVCVVTEPQVHLVERTKHFIRLQTIPQLTRAERKLLWEGYGSIYGLEGLDTRMAAGKYRLAAGEIAKAARRLGCLMAESGSLEQKLAKVCEEVLPSPVGGSIKQIHVTYTIEDLKLPEPQKQNLLAICAQVNHRQLVYDDWNMEQKFAYGRNVSAIFVGAPGTGKTMAVHVLSSMLNLPLYKIDLSQVVDKYIGETEKKLEEIFNLAEKSNSILFFDEADAIFGKRSEVNEAKDRYANTEVSYILQRIEQYDGIVILASNYKKNIDEAFMRRMRYLVEFPMPDPETRKAIWQGSFTDQVPVDEIDFDYLANTYELAGGIIKNIVLNAVFAAADAGESVGMKEILESMRNERMKMGKTMISRDFGKYEYLFE